MKTLLRLAAVAIALGLAAPALAQTTANITVTASVARSCHITATPIAFPAYDPLAGAAVEATGGITVTCTLDTGWWVGLNAGGNSAQGGGSPRAMANTTTAGTFLGYDLYSDPGRTTAWSNTQALGVAGTGAGVAQPATVYGRIRAGQNVPAGDYSDTVTATVNF